MRTEPLNGGTAPLRTSKNKAVGVVVCPTCKEPMTVHKANGKRKNLFYSICDNCGTDQRTGKLYQDFLSCHYPNLEELAQAKAKRVEPEQQAEPDLEPKPEQTAPVKALAPESETQTQTETEPETEPEETKKNPIFGVIIGGFVGGLLALAG